MSDTLNAYGSYDPQCPRCGQGGLRPAYLRPFGERPFWICEECDALWDQLDSPNEANFNDYVDFSNFMEAHGHTGDWHLAKERKVTLRPDSE